MGPPMWIVERGPASVCLFGDCPGARDAAWLTDEVRAAVLRSDELWCEVPGDEAVVALLRDRGLAAQAA